MMCSAHRIVSGIQKLLPGTQNAEYALHNNLRSVQLPSAPPQVTERRHASNSGGLNAVYSKHTCATRCRRALLYLTAQHATQLA
jgi:hypothetical protein